MEKINFIIPKKTNNKTHPIITFNTKNNMTPSVTATTTTTNDSVYFAATTTFSQIATNVYKFNSVQTNISEDIYILFDNASNYKQNGECQKALELLKECENKITNTTKKDLIYKLYIELALTHTELKNSLNIISNYYMKAINIYGDRAEPYYYWALLCNKLNQFETAYTLLQKALTLSYDEAVIKYPTTQITAYGKFLYDALSVSCYWLKKYEQSKQLLEEIIDDNKYNFDRERLEKNLKATIEELNKNHVSYHNITKLTS